MTQKAMKLSPEHMESLRERYGNLVDYIGIRRTTIDGYNDTYELSVVFRTRFMTSRLSEENEDRAAMHAAHKLCDRVDKTVLDRAPNRTPTNPANVTFHVSHNVPDGLVHISPRTYYEMMGR